MTQHPEDPTLNEHKEEPAHEEPKKEATTETEAALDSAIEVVKEKKEQAEHPELIRTVAFFDFDRTLAKNDSLPPFLIKTVGLRKTLTSLIHALIWPDKTQPDRRSGMKSAWLKKALTGVPIDKARSAALKLKPRWIKPIRQRLLELHQNGTTIIVATGALDLYINSLLKDLPIDMVMCTEMEVENGILTGKMKCANCVRKEKARRVKEYLTANAPFTITYGFGNWPSDIEMLELVDEKQVI